MNTKDVLYGLRVKNGLSQDELAGNLLEDERELSLGMLIHCKCIYNF